MNDIKTKAQNMAKEHIAFKCPMWQTIQSGRDLIEAGAGKEFKDIERYLGFSCLGRWTHQKQPPKKPGRQIGCNWTLGGLFSFHKLKVETPDGKIQPSFEIATPEESQKHAKTKQKSPTTVLMSL